MAYGNKEFNYETDENKESYIIEEKGNSYTQLAYERWNEDSDFKLALRKFYSSAKGETAGKGVTFMTEEGPSDLINALLKEGYGYPEEIAKICVENRPDIIGAIVYNHGHNSESDEDQDSLDQINDKPLMYFVDKYEEYNKDHEITSEEDMYDPEEILG